MKSNPTIALGERRVARIAFDAATGQQVVISSEGGQSAISAIIEWAEQNLKPEEIGQLSDGLREIAVRWLETGGGAEKFSGVLGMGADARTIASYASRFGERAAKLAGVM